MLLQKHTPPTLFCRRLLILYSRLDERQRLVRRVVRKTVLRLPRIRYNRKMALHQQCATQERPSKERTEYTWLNLNRRVRHQISVTPERSGLCLLRRFTTGSLRPPCRTTEGLNSVHTDSARSPRTANSLAHVYPCGPTTMGKIYDQDSNSRSIIVVFRDS